MKKLYIKQKVFKITDHYPILNEAQETVYQVDQDFKIFGNTVHVSDAQGRELFVVDKEIFTFLPRFSVTFSDGRVIYLKSRLTFFKKAIDVDPDGLGLVLQGDFWDYNFTLLQNNQVLGRIQKALLTWGDTYEISIHDESQQDLIVAMMIAVDCIKDDQERS